MPPDPDPIRDRFTYLSDFAEGEVLLPVWWRSADSVPPPFQHEYPQYRVGRFRYHFHPSYRWPKRLRRPAMFLFYLRTGWRLHRQKKFDVIVVYGTNATGLAAVALKRLTGARLIVEIPGVPENAFRYEQPRPGLRGATRRFVANRLLNFVGSRADCMKLLYPGQLACYPRLQRKPCAVFHDFVPVGSIRALPAQERFVVSVGYPWYTKGMDVLIRAFRAVAPEFPDFRLKLMGHFPDRRYLDELAAACPQIEFIKPGSNDDALRVIGACAAYVLASRTEGMGRVLLEAMAAGKPVIASAVGGVPNYVSDGRNGLLFKPEDPDDLAARLRILLADDQLRARLGAAGLDRVRCELDERAYARAFGAMLAGLTGSQPPAVALAPKSARAQDAAGAQPDWPGR
ncbi:MAG: glycosyltransferase family 4 protein [Terriglobales bacterium]